MGRKKQRKLERKIGQEKQQEVKAPTDPKIEKFKVYGLLFIVFAVYLGFSIWQITSPFIHVSEDTNGTNGVGAANLSRFNFFPLKFGLYNRWLNVISDKQLSGKFYVHHPIGFLIPTTIFYKLFGINEITTRLGPLFLSIIAIILFYLALYKIFKNPLLAFLSSFTLVILPGMIYYGKHLDMSPPSLAFMLITFSLFIFYHHSGKKVFFYLFLSSVFLGGLTAWHYYVMLLGIYIFILFTNLGKSTPKRTLILILIPVLIIVAVSVNLLHIYILNGQSAGLDSLKSALFQRSARQISAAWFSRIGWTSKLNFTLLFIITAALGFIFSIFKTFSNRKLLFFVPIAITPVIILLAFQQWSTHPFGVIYFLPFIGAFSGILFYYLIEYFKIAGILAVISIFVFGIYLSLENQKFFYEKFLILGPKDPEILKEIKPQIKDNELCIGGNNLGLDYNGIANWYLQKETLESPSCFPASPIDKSTSTPENANLKYGLIFHPGLGDFFKKELLLFEQNGFKNLVKCGNNWCLISK